MNISFLNPPLATSSEDRRKRAKWASEIFVQRLNREKARNDNRWKVWVEMHKEMADTLTIDNLLMFQSHPSLGPQITGGSGHHFLKKISDQYGQNKLDFLLSNHTESVCGQPKDLVCENGTYITVTSMRHLYHIAKLQHFCNFLYGTPLPFIEIGGGFGNLARMVCQYNLCSKYYIIDHPVLHAIQSFYLTDFFPSADIATLGDKDQYLTGSEDSKIHLCSLFDFERVIERIEKPYVLVSTMALTEIPKSGQDKYMDVLSPDTIYVFGQFRNVCLGGGKSAESQGFDNESFIYRLGRNFHTLDYNFWGYHFEYIGRNKTFL